MHELKHIIESLLFVADEPLSVDKLRGIIETADGKQIREALQSLADEYEQRTGGFFLREIAGGWQMRSRPEYHEWIKRMLQPSPHRLSRAALETLALIAYKQPIIRADIEHVRGVDCGGVLRQLMERKLIRVLGRKEIAGRPLIYATTKLFLEIFDLKDLNDLPTPMEIAEFGATLREGQNEDAARNPAQIALDDPNAPGVSKVPGQPCPESIPVQEPDDSHSDQTGPLSDPDTPRSEGKAGPEEKNDTPTPKNT